MTASAPDKETTGILFVCLGNICRSPLAEAALRQIADAASMDLVIDSAGTAGWHADKAPDPRACVEAARRGVNISGYRARQVVPADFDRFDMIFALDRQNFADLQSMSPAHGRASLSLLLDLVPGFEGHDVADPYYGDAEDFARTWSEVSQAAHALVARLRSGRG